MASIHSFLFLFPMLCFLGCFPLLSMCVFGCISVCTSPAACLEGIQQLSEALAYKITFHDLSHVLWESLYVGEPSSSRIEPLLWELE